MLTPWNRVFQQFLVCRLRSDTGSNLPKIAVKFVLMIVWAGLAVFRQQNLKSGRLVFDSGVNPTAVGPSVVEKRQTCDVGHRGVSRPGRQQDG